MNKNPEIIKKLWDSTMNMAMNIPIFIPYSDHDFADKQAENNKIIEKEVSSQKILVKNYPFNPEERAEWNIVHRMIDGYLKQKLAESEIDSLKEKIINIQKLFFKKLI
jgi:hypothetical protein